MKQGLSPRMKHLLIAAVVYVLFQFVIPAPPPITRAGMGVVGIFIATLWLWCTEGSGWPSLLYVGMIGTTGVCSAADLFAKTWGNVMVPFLVACFILNAVMSKTGLTRRIALWFITRPSCKGKPWRILFMFFVAVMLLGFVCTSSPIIVLFMALAEEIFSLTGYKKGDEIAKAVMIGILFVGSMSQAITPVSHVLVTMVFDYIEADFGFAVSYVKYMGMMLPVAVAFFLVFWLVFRFLMKPEVDKLAALDIDALRASVPKMSRQEKVVAITYALVIVVWLFPDLFNAVGLTAVGGFMKKLGTGIPALVAAGLLCGITVGGEPIITMQEANKGVAWNSVYIMTAVMGSAYIFGLESCGVTAWLMQTMEPVLGGMPAILFVLCVAAFIMVMTNFLSNTLTASMYTVFIPIAMAIAGVNPVAVALIIAAGCNISMATPSCCPAGGLASGAGWTPVGYQMKWGWPLAAAYTVILAGLAYPLGCLMFPV